jgi:hypothetical protein
MAARQRVAADDPTLVQLEADLALGCDGQSAPGSGPEELPLCLGATGGADGASGAGGAGAAGGMGGAGAAGGMGGAGDGPAEISDNELSDSGHARAQKSPSFT